MTTLAQDTCIRANQSGLGTASDGNAYTVAGASVATAIVNDEAQFSSETGFSSAILGAGTASTVVILARVQLTNFFQAIGPQWAWQDASNFYTAVYYNAALTIFKFVNGAPTAIGTYAYSPTLNGYYWIEATQNGTTLTATIWQDGTTQPGSPQISITDSTFSGGRYGMGVNGQGVTCAYDHLLVTDGASQQVVTFYSATWKAPDGKATWKAPDGKATWKAPDGAMIWEIDG